MTKVEDMSIGAKVMGTLLALAWVGGSGMAVWAADQENRISNIEEDQESVQKSTEVLAGAVQTLTVELKLMRQRRQLEREYGTVSGESPRPPVAREDDPE